MQRHMLAVAAPILAFALWWPCASAGPVRAVVIDPTDPSRINAGTESDGVMRSTSGGNAGTWSFCNNGLGSLLIRSLAVDPSNPNKVFAATHTGLHKSTDGGASWALVWP